jgi:hypothetical protein
MVALLYPHNSRTFDDRLSHFRLFRQGDAYLIEWRTPHGVLDTWNLAAGEDTVSCQSGAVVVERNRTERIGLSHLESHYKHVLAALPDGGLAVSTGVTGRYIAGIDRWPSEPREYSARFRKLGPGGKLDAVSVPAAAGRPAAVPSR